MTASRCLTGLRLATSTASRVVGNGFSAAAATARRLRGGAAILHDITDAYPLEPVDLASIKFLAQQLLVRLVRLVADRIDSGE